jgi:hypothetical protein
MIQDNTASWKFEITNGSEQKRSLPLSSQTPTIVKSDTFIIIEIDYPDHLILELFFKDNFQFLEKLKRYHDLVEVKSA